MKSPLPFLQLPLQVDLEGLRKDLAHCLLQTWPEHFNTRDYSGSWKVIALRSPSGSMHNAYAHGDQFQDVPLLQECPAVLAFLHQLECPLEAVRMLRLAPGSQIHTHKDQGLAYLDGTFRLHIPIMTHPDARFVIGGEEIHFPAGTCWYGNFSLPHSVDNLSNVDRVHLVVDGNRNGWTDELFSRAGMDLSTESESKAKFSQEEWRRVVAELERTPNPHNLALANSLRETHQIWE